MHRTKTHGTKIKSYTNDDARGLFRSQARGAPPRSDLYLWQTHACVCCMAVYWSDEPIHVPVVHMWRSTGQTDLKMHTVRARAHLDAPRHKEGRSERARPRTRTREEKKRGKGHGRQGEAVHPHRIIIKSIGERLRHSCDLPVVEVDCR